MRAQIQINQNIKEMATLIVKKRRKKNHLHESQGKEAIANKTLTARESEESNNHLMKLKLTLVQPQLRENK